MPVSDKLLFVLYQFLSGNISVKLYLSKRVKSVLVSNGVEKITVLHVFVCADCG